MNVRSVAPNKDMWCASFKLLKKKTDEKSLTDRELIGKSSKRSSSDAHSSDADGCKRKKSDDDDN